MRRNPEVIEECLGGAGARQVQGEFAIGDGDGLIGDGDEFIGLGGDVVNDDEVFDLNQMRALSMTGVAAGQGDEIGAVGEGIAPSDGGAGVKVNEGIEGLITVLFAFAGVDGGGPAVALGIREDSPGIAQEAVGGGGAGGLEVNGHGAPRRGRRRRRRRRGRSTGGRRSDFI